MADETSHSPVGTQPRRRPRQQSPGAVTRESRGGYRPVRSPLISMGPSLSETRRRRRYIRNGALGLCALVLVGFIASFIRNEFTSESSLATESAPAQVLTGPLGRPEPLTLATVPADGLEEDLRIQLPIAKRGITAIGYARHIGSGLLDFEPAGATADQSAVSRLIERLFTTNQSSGLKWWNLDGSSAPNIVHVGARPGTDVYAPVAGTIIAIADDVVDGRRRGDVVQLQLLGDASTLIIIRGISAIDDISVGQTVSVGTTQLGTVREPDATVQPALARVSHDDGASVELYVRNLQVGATS